MVDPKTIYRLADGIIVSIGPMETFLVDLESDEEVAVDFRHVPTLEKLTLGIEDRELEGELASRLLDQGVLTSAPPAPDPVIRERLARLDDLYLGAYRHTLSERALRAYEAVLTAHARRKRFFEQVGQCPILPETALRRALWVGDADEVGTLDVLCLGDDDLVSVALAVLGHRVTAYDIDDFLLTFLTDLSRDLDLGLRIVERDLRDPISDQESEAFDVFLTDPMSNRDCLEIFLSRALSLLKPHGIGFSAVYAPVGRLFAEIAEEMKLPITRWHRRHNRYYSKHFRLHNYESDWVELRKTPETVIPLAPDEFSVPLNLYREDYFQRAKSVLLFIEEIEEIKWAQPLYLEMIIDGLAEATGLNLSRRVLHLGQAWTVIHCPTPEGYLTLHVDRDHRQLRVDLYPFDPQVEDATRRFLMAAYKTRATTTEVAVSRAGWDVRIR